MINQQTNRNLMKAIAENEDKNIRKDSPLPYDRRIKDSDTCSWVPFDFWLAHTIVNYRKEALQIQIYNPVDIQPECGEKLWGWQHYDSSTIENDVREKESPIDKFNSLTEIGRRDSFYEMIKQDQQEKRNEGDYSGIVGYSQNNRRL